jgi:hypothetical protein
MRVFLTGHGTRPERMAWYRESLNALAPRYQLTSSPQAADLILCAEPGTNKFRNWTKVLELDPMISAYPEKIFVYEFSDRPVAFLPGLYVSMQRHRIDWARMRPADRWTEIDRSTERALLDRSREPRLLFSFRGSQSARVRERLFTLDVSDLSASITQTYRWWDYGSADVDEDKRLYLDELRDSHFVLCPRGLSPSTVRIYEAMQLGRVPVILADDWIPPPGIPWPDFSLRVAEDRFRDLPDILERRRDDAAEMGRAARDSWERYMKPGSILMRRWLRAIEEITEMRPAGWNEAGYYRQWRSSRFRWENKIHVIQGAAQRVRRGRTAVRRPSESAPRSAA